MTHKQELDLYKRALTLAIKWIDTNGRRMKCEDLLKACGNDPTHCCLYKCEKHMADHFLKAAGRKSK